MMGWDGEESDVIKQDTLSLRSGTRSSRDSPPRKEILLDSPGLARVRGRVVMALELHSAVNVGGLLESASKRDIKQAKH